MAHPPPARPAAAPPVDQAALDEAHVQRLEQHVDAWLRGQRHDTPQTVEVSIGERDSISPEVLAKLCDRYTKAGWSKATTAQDIEGDKLNAPRPDPRGIVLTLVP